MFKFVHLINLDRSQDRLENFLNRNKSISFKRFAAVDGKFLNNENLINDGIINTDNIYSKGALGCALSHIFLWKKCILEKKIFHICEDDAIFRQDFWSKLGEFIDKYDDWDIILWGYNIDWPMIIEISPDMGWCDLYFHDNMFNQQEFSAARSNPGLFKLISCAGLTCYSISPRGAEKILQKCLPMGSQPARSGRHSLWANNGIDVELSRHFCELNAFVSIPRLVFSPNDTSTIDRTGLHQFPGR